MKSYLLIAMIIFGFSSFAQHSHHLDDTHAPEKRASHTVAQIVDKVQLVSEQQRDSLFTVFKYYYDDVITYRNAKREKMIVVITKLRDEQVAKILSPSQYTEYSKYMEEVRIAEMRRNLPKQKYGHKSM